MGWGLIKGFYHFLIIFIMLEQDVNFNFTLLDNVFHQKFGFANHLSFLIGADASDFEEPECLKYGRHY